jgi:hypothetical protein
MPTINYWNGTKWVRIAAGEGGTPVPGPQGPPGKDGTDGKDGRSVSVTVSQNAPASPLAGDVWITTPTP